MKKIILLLVFITGTLHAQNYDKHALEVGLGLSKIRDVTSVQPLNVDLAYRYMLNTKFGGEIGLNHMNLKDYDYKYSSISFMGIANFGRIAGFESFAEWYTIKVGIGGNLGHGDYYTSQNILHRDTNFHLKGLVENEFRLTNSLFLTLGLDIVPGINSRPFRPVENYTQTTSILNFNVGFVVSIGKHKEHADFYLEPQRIDTILLKPTIQNHYTETIVEVDKSKPYSGYVQFEYDSSKFISGSQAPATIKTALQTLKEGGVILLTGYASPENGTGNPRYNYDLANERAETVKSYLLSLGANPDKIEIKSLGAFPTFDGRNIELSRSVKIEHKY